MPNLPLDSLEATRQLACALLERAPRGSLLLLEGPLGAGKTTLVQQLGIVLGSVAHISSPSYTLIHEYPTPEGLLVHIDAYRLPEPKADALEGLGLEDYLARARLTVIEWGGALADTYPEATLVRLEFDGETRRASVQRAGQPSAP